MTDLFDRLRPWIPDDGEFHKVEITNGAVKVDGKLIPVITQSAWQTGDPGIVGRVSDFTFEGWFSAPDVAKSV